MISSLSRFSFFVSARMMARTVLPSAQLNRIARTAPFLLLAQTTATLTEANRTRELHSSSLRSSDTSSSTSSVKTLDLSKVAAAEFAHKDIVSLIRSEHELVSKLGKKYQSTTNKAEKLSIAYNIIKLLSLHSAKEEMALYPVIRNKFPNGDQIIDHALNEHLQIKKDLYDLDKNLGGEITPTIDAKLLQALKDTEHHVAEEEEQVLTKIPKYLSPSEMTKVRDDFVSALSVSPSRPHPDAPDQGAKAKIANAGTMPLDATRDAARFAFTTPTKVDLDSLNTMAR